MRPPHMGGVRSTSPLYPELKQQIGLHSRQGQRTTKMGKDMHRLLLVGFLLSVLSGCGANFTTAFRTYEPTDSLPKSALIDAKQRAILVAPGTNYSAGKEVERKILVCAEPSPDALSAISSSLSTSVGGLFPSGAEVQAALSQALSETASQLGVRNATIQLLRDGLYRQCEAYMNGLIDRFYYEQIANKYVNAMVALLAIEQLAPVSASPTSIRASDGGTVSTTTTVDIKGASPETKPADATDKGGTGTDSGTTSQGTEKSTTQNVEANAAGHPSGSSHAAAPVTSVNLPGSDQRNIPDHVSRAVATMVTWFLTKDTIDYCLRAMHEPDVNAQSSFQTSPFVTMCQNIIQDQVQQQGDYLAAVTAGIPVASAGPQSTLSRRTHFARVFNQSDDATKTKFNDAAKAVGYTGFSVLAKDEAASSRKLDQFESELRSRGVTLN